MPTNDPFSLNGMQDPIMGGYGQQPVDPAAAAALQAPSSGVQLPPLLSKPMLSEQLLNMGTTMIRGGQAGLDLGGSIAFGLKAYNDTLEQEKKKEEEARHNRLLEYELMGRIKERQLAEQATLRKFNALDQFKKSNPAFAALAEIDPQAAVAAKIKSMTKDPVKWENVGGTLFKLEPGKDPVAYGQNGKPMSDAMGGAAANGDLSGDDFLKTLDPNFAKQVKLYAEGHLAMPSSRSKNFQQVITAVTQYDPTFDAVNYNARAATRKAFTSGIEGRTVNSLNTVLGHIGDLQDKIDTLHNGKNMYVNTIGNYYNKVTGDPAITNYQANAKAVSDEIVKVWRASGGSQADVEEAQKALDSSQSPAQLRGALATYAGLLHSKLDALDQQYKSGMGTAADTKGILTPKSIKTLKTLGVDVEEPTAPEAPIGTGTQEMSDPIGAGQSLLDQPTEADPMGKVYTPKTQAEFDDVPVGKKFVDPEDGKTYTK